MASENKIGALWLSKYKDDDGNDIWTGDIGDVKVKMYTNKYKTQSKHPDFVIYKTVPKPKQENQEPQKTWDDVIPSKDEDIPF